MSRQISRWRLAGTVLFAAAVVSMAGVGLYQVAARHWRVQPTFHIRAQFESISGLNIGHPVRFQGIDAGTVEKIIAPTQPGAPVELILRLDERIHSLVRTDTVARIVSEGLIGARAVELTPGEPTAPQVADFDSIRSERPIQLADILQRASTSLDRLDTVAREAEKGLGDINKIAATISQGEGTLGKLVRDDAIYNNLVSVSHRGERSLAALEENLDALKQTWPISRYFNQRAYLDRERVLFQPGSTKNSRSLNAELLFEHGHAILTPVGRSQLDELAKWFTAAIQPKSEVVIAAFTGADEDENLAEILTQEQADAVRRYLVEKHSIQYVSLFRSRKVASVGFGTHHPKTLDPTTPDQLSRRVEIILFTPQT
jgi:phospholipid/cholesterol/gamma-HCH transport system substrate-binding protein